MPHETKLTKPLVTLYGGSKAVKRYFEANHSTTCIKCGSESVIELVGKSGRRYLSEIFEISDQLAVYSPADFHSSYCMTEGISSYNRITTERARQTRLNEIMAKFVWGDKSDDAHDPPDPADHGGRYGMEFPFYCMACGAMIYNDREGRYRNQEDNERHTCSPSIEHTDIDKARARGSTAGMRIKFIEISTRMETVERMMQKHHGTEVTVEGAHLAAEFLILRNRLWTEIP